jgi:hypothetical protein
MGLVGKIALAVPALKRWAKIKRPCGTVGGQPGR